MALVAAYVGHVRRQAEGAGAGDARERKYAAEARLKEMEVAEREGRVIPAEEVEATWSLLVDATKEAFLNLAGSAVQAGLCRPEQEGALDALVRDALMALGKTQVEEVK